MTRPQLCALIQTLVEARDTIETQARLSGCPALCAAPVKALDYSLALLESDLIDMDAGESHPEDEARRELPRWSRPKQPVVYVPNRGELAVDTVELAAIYHDECRGVVIPSCEE